MRRSFQKLDRRGKIILSLSDIVLLLILMFGGAYVSSSQGWAWWPGGAILTAVFGSFMIPIAVRSAFKTLDVNE